MTLACRTLFFWVAMDMHWKQVIPILVPVGVDAAAKVPTSSACSSEHERTCAWCGSSGSSIQGRRHKRAVN